MREQAASIRLALCNIRAGAVLIDERSGRAHGPGPWGLSIAGTAAVIGMGPSGAILIPSSRAVLSQTCMTAISGSLRHDSCRSAAAEREPA